MSNSLVDFIGRFKSVFDKSSVSKTVNDTYEELTALDELFYSISFLANPEQKFTDENTKMINAFYKVFSKNPPKGVKFTVTNLFLRDITTCSKNLRLNLDFVSEGLDKYKTSKISLEGSSVELATLIRAVGDIRFVIKFTMDLINLLVAREITASTQLPTDITKYTIDQLSSNIDTYVKLLAVYCCGTAQFSSAIKNLPKILISSDDDRMDLVVEGGVVDITNGIAAGFRGNPFYMIGMYFINKRQEVHNANKQRAALLKLRIEYLRQVSGGSPDAKTEKDIRDLQSKLNKLEFEIEKFNLKYDVE